MRFSYKQLREYFSSDFPTVEELAEVLTMHSSEVEEIIPADNGDWELEIKILPDRSGDAKTALGLAREINSLFPKLTPKEAWLVADQSTARAEIIFTAEQINGLLGTALSREKIIGFLNRVRASVVENDDGTLTALIPAERLDLNIKEDLADEVARLLGYDQIPARQLSVEGPTNREATFDLINRVRAQLAGEGYNEIYGYTFVDHGEVAVEKPLASDKAYLRNNLSDGLKREVEFNLGRVLFDDDEVKLFEIGTVFNSLSDGQTVVTEEIRVATGFGCKKPKLKIEITEKKLADFADLKNNLADLENFINSDVHYQPVSIYPRIIRDIAVWVPEETDIELVGSEIKTSAGALCVEGPILFDEFVKGGRKSLAFRLVFQSFDKTLSDDEVNKEMETVTAKLQTNGWEVR